ncbi:MAG TPA: ACT domain-containing protein, partial [Nitrospirae bacterium]|nr:ACT domain-containing protein [Nitrospirota bacterium]
YIQNNDMPGVIGNIGMILGENGINIARMHFGRELKGGRAISVVSVDAEIPDDIVNKIKAMPNINQVKIIRL